jgi:hypothetical protein
MYSKALIPKLNILDFLQQGQSHNKVCICKNFWLPLYNAVVCSSILQIRETGFTAPLVEKS